MSPTHLSIIGHVFMWESFVCYQGLIGGSISPCGTQHLSIIQNSEIVRYLGAVNVLCLQKSQLVHPQWSVIQRMSAIERVLYRRFLCIF